MKQFITKIMMAAALLAPTAAFAENYSIGTGSQSGTYYPLGGMLAKIWSENIPEINARAEVTAASVETSSKCPPTNSWQVLPWVTWH